MHFGHTHTTGDAVAYLPKHKILCTGDACVNGAFNYMGHSNSASWIKCLEEMEKLDVDIVCPGHGKRDAQGPARASRSGTSPTCATQVKKGIDDEEVARGDHGRARHAVVQGVDRRGRDGDADDQGQRQARLRGADGQDRPRPARPQARSARMATGGARTEESPARSPAAQPASNARRERDSEQPTSRQPEQDPAVVFFDNCRKLSHISLDIPAGFLSPRYHLDEPGGT